MDRPPNPEVERIARGGVERETALPELELREIRRSAQPVVEPEAPRVDERKEVTKKIECLRPWNNYTIVTVEGSDDIQIFDEELKLVPDFKVPASSKEGVVDWQKMDARLKNKSYIGRDNNNDPTECPISLVPAVLREATREKLKRSGQAFLLMGALGVEKFTPTHFEIVQGGKYIVFSDKRGVYFAFLTESQSGVVLAPRNWVRINYTDVGVDQQLIEKEVVDIVAVDGGLVKLNTLYDALVTDVGINIVDHNIRTGRPVFSDKVPSISRNVAVDPGDPNIIYYCDSSNPSGMMRLNLEGEPNTWSSVAAKFPKSYENVDNLQLDPSGNFFLFYSKEGLVVLTKEGLEEVKKVPGLTQVNFDTQGRIRAVDEKGHLVIYEPNFSAFAGELDKRRASRLAAGIDIAGIFDAEVVRQAEAQARTASLEHMQPLRERYREQFVEVLVKVTTPEGIQQLRAGLTKLRGTLMGQGLKPNEVAFVLEGLEDLIIDKEKTFAIPAAREALTLVRARLASGLSIGSISEARSAMDAVRAQEALLPEDLRMEIRKAAQELEDRSVELFRQRGGEIIKDIQGLIERTRTDLGGFTSKLQMDDWLEFRYPQLKSRLGSLAKDCPLEADDAYKAIMAARVELQTIADEFEDRFKREYVKVREKAAERLEAAVDILEADIDGLIERLQVKGFANRRLAEEYLASSEARRALAEEITALSAQNPDAAREMDRALKVRISNALTEIERGALTQVAETGQQMVMFGEVPFPKWEAKVKEKEARKVDLVFEEDSSTHGPGVKAGDIMGDAVVAIRSSHGKVEKVRLYEGLPDESEWRLGLKAYRSPSYLSAAEFRKVKKEYSDWAQGEKSPLRDELAKKKSALEELYAQRRQTKARTAKEVDTVKDREYREKLKAAMEDYTAFFSEHCIGLFNRIDKIKKDPEIEYTNGKGFVPEWQNHWVMDSQTEEDLEGMAKAFKMQLDLQEGLLNLNGHAGTGKDVRMKMFCALTKRPYFGIDCTKWTTEFELSEDVVLEAEGGASQTIKVPSAVLNGITTPGAVVYFNEFNAMPEQAQIFLHALMDEKRSLTLKTSSGKVIKAHSSVLLASSMNPGYPGTFTPQFATRSRMVSLDIGYPPLTRKQEAGDTNPNLPYDASEALRIARGVDSLADLTYEANLERNEFARMWDKYVNGIENGAAEPTGEQKFDVDTILALVQFANNLRDNFITIFEKTRDARKALPVTQPITGRELRRCAYALSKMTPEEKATANPENVARDLLETYFLTHIDKKEDKDKIRTAMSTWTLKKRVGA